MISLLVLTAGLLACTEAVHDSIIDRDNYHDFQVFRAFPQQDSDFEFLQQLNSQVLNLNICTLKPNFYKFNIYRIV